MRKALNKDENALFYGPVFSRRFGFSLGIDIIPYKVCNYDCIYCALGRAGIKTVERKSYKQIDLDNFSKNLKMVIGKSERIDYITFSGSGEPTLNRDLGSLVDVAKSVSNIPVLILTNGSLLYRDDVIRDISTADAIKVSLDACDDEVLKKINRPDSCLIFDDIYEGIFNLAKNYTGNIFLEIMLIKGINDAVEQAEMYKNIISEFEKVRALDKIHLNIPSRPPAEQQVCKPSSERLLEIKRVLGRKAEIVKERKVASYKTRDSNMEAEITALVKRRPANIRDVSASFGISANEALKILNNLKSDKIIKGKFFNGKYYYYV